VFFCSVSDPEQPKVKAIPVPKIVTFWSHIFAAGSRIQSHFTVSGSKVTGSETLTSATEHSLDKVLNNRLYGYQHKGFTQYRSTIGSGEMRSRMEWEEWERSERVVLLRDREGERTVRLGYSGTASSVHPLQILLVEVLQDHSHYCSYLRYILSALRRRSDKI